VALRAGGLKRKLQILKLGGSVITHKDEYFSAYTENIRRLAMEISANKKPLIIVHGAGSFGHPVAKKYNISDGLKTPDQLIGFSETHQSMTHLNQIIVDTLLDAGVPAFGLSASSMLITEDKRLVNLDLGIVKRCLELGLVPVMYGDAVLDTEQGFAILSGDQLIVRLAIELQTERVIFGSDVDGVFTANPKLDPEAKLLEKVSLGNMTAEVGESTNTDVTGGMLGKLIEAEAAIKAGAEVIFLNANTENRVRSALLGEKVMGTLLTL
jgi:isopentenyl phosphate kinase